MFSSIITDLGSVFINPAQLRTVSIARAYYFWSNYKSSYVPKETYEMLDVPEYGSQEWSNKENRRAIKGTEYHVMIRTIDATYLIRVGQNYEDAQRSANRIIRGVRIPSNANGNVNQIDLRREEYPNFIVTLMPAATTAELMLNKLEEL